MSSESHVAGVRDLLSLVTRAIVAMPDEVAVTVIPKEHSVVFHIRVARGDISRVIGRGGRTARSLRIILGAISSMQGESYQLDIDEGSDVSVATAKTS